MIFPSINDLSKDGRYNKYKLVIATAKCARILTDEYVHQREFAEKKIANKETDKSLAALIKKEYRDEKAVKNAVNRLYDGRFKIIDGEDEVEEEAESANEAEDEVVSEAESESLSDSENEAPASEQEEL